jgi:hypothetical protein
LFLSGSYSAVPIILRLSQDLEAPRGEGRKEGGREGRRKEERKKRRKGQTKD